MASLKRVEVGRLNRKKMKKFSTVPFLYVITIFVGIFFCIEVAVLNYLAVESDESKVSLNRPKHPAKEISLPEHLLPHIPILPLFDSIPNAQDHITDLLDGRPTMAGVVALLQKFIADLHDSNMKNSKVKQGQGKAVLDDFYSLAEKHIKPFDDAYHGKHIFPLREDGSIFISIAAFREFYLLETLVSAFRNAKNPEKVFVGAVVQNCFGRFREDGSLDTSGKPCFMGPKVIGQDADGKPIKDTPAIPPEKNGVKAFCALPDYEQFCKNGQVRVVYMHHTDGQGPSMARYLASKLWGGENYYMQIDSHLRFADEWDAKYIADIKLTSNYPKSVFSSYPPGFEQVRFIPKRMNVDRSKINNETVIESPGCRLCHCSAEKGKNPMIIIQQSKAYEGNEERPMQQPFLGAGLVFAHGNFLKDVPYDPYLPWTFMGEEIILSMRAWTHGWNMYAPRKNLIIHQYRPGKLGLPKFYGSVRLMFKDIRNDFMKRRVNRRMKNLAGYPGHTADKIRKDGLDYVLTDIDKYGMGTERSRDEFFEFSEIKIDNKTGNLNCTKRLAWCMDQTLA